MLLAKYMAFAALAIWLNLTLQFFSLGLYQGRGSLFIAMGIGTASGLLIKYYFDSYFIFQSTVELQKNDLLRLIKYTVTGVLTTIFFWTVEVMFHVVWGQPYAKYIGAAVGLSVGYYIKFLLDQKYVFKGSEVNL